MFTNYVGKMLIKELDTMEFLFLEEMDDGGSYLGIEAERLETGEVAFRAWCERDAEGGGQYLCLYLFVDVVQQKDLALLLERAKRYREAIDLEEAPLLRTDEYLIGLATNAIEDQFPRQLEGWDLPIWKLGDSRGWSNDKEYE